MRKLGKKNKISFVIFTFIVILVVAIFVYGINRVLSYEKEEYELTTGSVLYDEDNNFLSLNSASFMSRNWNGKYYVTLEDETSYNLGEETVVFNSNDYRMYLYGTFYQVFENGKVEKHVGQTEVVRNTEAKVYKLKDRKYLIVASKIATEDLSVNTANYLIIEIDKIGNALLMNNEINIKTIVPTVLKTDDFNFDIANEKLVFGKTYIDLKKINGSTNEYVEPVKKPTTNNNSGGSTGGTGGTGGAGGAGAGDGGANIGDGNVPLANEPAGTVDLNDNNTPLEEKQPEDIEDNDTPLADIPLPVLIAIIAAIIALIVAIILAIAKRRYSDSDEEGEE